jgi:hypothetical protein
MRKLKFDLQVDPTALLAANPEAFYSAAYLTSDVPNNFRTLPGVKYQTKLGTVVFGNVLQSSTCAWPTPGSSDDLSAVLIDVCAVSAMAQICQFDLEQSFVSLQMTKGSNSDFSVASFMNFYWETMAKTVAQDIENIRWKGDTLSVDPTLALCDGYEKKLTAGLTPPPGVTPVISGGSGSITSFTALETAISTAFALLPASVASKTEELRIYLPTQLVNIYRLGVASGNTNAYITQDLSLTYLGIKIVQCQGMSNNTFVITLKDNLIYAFDAEGDSSDLRAVNLRDTVAEPYIRTRADMKIGFHYVNPGEIVFYS